MSNCSRCNDPDDIAVYSMIMPGETRVTQHCFCNYCFTLYEEYEVEDDGYDEEDEHHDIDTDPIDAECEDDPVIVMNWNAATAQEVDSDDPE